MQSATPQKQDEPKEIKIMITIEWPDGHQAVQVCEDFILVTFEKRDPERAKLLLNRLRDALEATEAVRTCQCH